MEQVIMMFTANARRTGVPVFSTEHHRTTVDLGLGDRFLIRLIEDPEIWDGWRANKTHGLQVVDSWYAPQEPEREFTGGFRYWSIRATTPGKQFFRAVYWRRDGMSTYPPVIFQIQVNVACR